ncbi:MAG: tetratricopeptide repeat protein [Candidatus Brocadiae bacterium]|nr:tetratricopeptide repeat protein [Candidatus Brocadiia bacterium]
MKIFGVFFLIFFSCAIAQDDRMVYSEQELWLEYMKAYTLKNDLRREFLVRSYPEWSDQYARRLMTGYLSFFLKEDTEVAQKNLDVLKSIGELHKTIFGSSLLLKQAKFYELLSQENKKQALEAILISHQAKVTKNAMYLFSLELEHQNSLDKDQISEEIQKQFEKNNRTLSSLSAIEGKDKGKEWLIHDKGTNPGKKYLLVFYKDKIVVYQIELYQRALEIFRQIQDEYSIADTLNSLANLAHAQGRTQDASLYFAQCLELFEKMQDNLNVAKALNSLGLLAYSDKEYEKAHKYYQKATESAAKTENYTAKATILNNLGALHKTWQKYEEAIKFFDESLNYYTILRDAAGIATALNNLGAIYLEQKDYPKAKENLEKSLMISRDAGDEGGMAHTLNILASLYTAKEEYQKSQLCLEESLKIGKKFQNESMVKSTLLEMQELQKKQFPTEKTKEYYQDKLDIAKMIGSAVDVVETEKEIAQLEKVERPQSQEAKYKNVIMIVLSFIAFFILTIVVLWIVVKYKK